MKVVPLLLALLCIAHTPLSAAEAPPSPAPQDPVLVLEPLKIHGSPIISYAIDMSVFADPKTKLVSRIFITRVLPGTDAERAGLQAGDEIVKLDGKSVKEFDAVISMESPLGEIFLNRDPGEPLRLEVITRRTQHFTLRAQRDDPLTPH